ncbi:MAG: hypothetical protein ACT4OP_12610, partial [Actinomycetota bacterium]
MTLILLLVVIAAVIALPLILVARRHTKGTGTSAVEIVTYLVLVAASVLTTNAISSLLEMVMPGDGVLVRQADDLALTLATLIVAGIVWLTVWMALERRIGGSPSPGRGLYVSVTASIAMAVTAAATIRLLLAAIGDLEFEASGPGDLIAFGGLWALVAWLRRPVDPLDQLR